MIATILRMLTLAQLGAGVKRAMESGMRQLVVIVLASVLMLTGFLFALLAGYIALSAVVPPLQAAAIMSVGLLLTGGVLIALRKPLSSRKPRIRERDSSMAETALSLEQGARAATRSLGSTNVIALSLIAGLAAGHFIRR